MKKNNMSSQFNSGRFLLIALNAKLVSAGFQLFNVVLSTPSICGESHRITLDPAFSNRRVKPVTLLEKHAKLVLSQQGV